MVPVSHLADRTAGSSPVPWMWIEAELIASSFTTTPGPHSAAGIDSSAGHPNFYKTPSCKLRLNRQSCEERLSRCGSHLRRAPERSEERRVGKECRSRWWRDR